MLVTDETQGCIQRKLPQVQLSLPHSSSLIDLDGDCLSDLFLTVKDVNTGKYFYEIYLRREKGTLIDSTDFDGNETASTG